MNELGIQRLLVEACITQGGFAHKMSNRFLVGVPDLFVKMPDWPTTIVEVKYAPKVRRDGTVALELSPHQSRHIARIQLAKGHAGWLVVARGDKPGRYFWHSGRELDYTKAVVAAVKEPGE